MQSRLTRRGKMFLAILIFLATASFAIITNGLMQGDGIHLDYSISRYVGLATLSAIIFALGNFVVTDCMAERLYEIGRVLRMPKLFYILVVVTAIALIGLSVCPIGYFDRVFGVESVPSQVHQICSRTMFACMLLISVWLVFHPELTLWARVWCLCYAVFAIICATSFILEFEWFMKGVLIFESCYLLWFMVLITNLKCPGLEKSFIKKVANTKSRKKSGE